MVIDKTILGKYLSSMIISLMPSRPILVIKIHKISQIQSAVN